MNIITLNSRFALQLFAIITIFSLLASMVPMQAFATVNEHQVRICHANGGGTYSAPIPTKAQIYGDIGAVDGPNAHGSLVAGVHPDDIIPPFVAGSQGSNSWGDYPGKNWNSAGQAILNNSCAVRELPTTGTIVINKVTNPAADPQSFAFTANGTGYNSFSLTDADTPNSQTLIEGTYSVWETLPNGWTQTSAVCSSNLQVPQTPRNITLNAGETVTCTFTNTKNPVVTTGFLVVKKIVVGGTAATTSFQYTINPGTPTNFEADGVNEVLINSGTYNITEVAAANYNVTYNNCSAVVVAPDTATSSRTCTITNTYSTSAPVDDTTITIKKMVNTSTTDTFNFYLDGSTNTIAATVVGGQSSAPIVVTPGSHNIREGLTAGWTLTNAECRNEQNVIVGGEDGPYYLTLATGEDIACTFTNTKDSVPTVLGCTNESATNFNPRANTNDQSCEYNYVSQCVVATNLLQNGSFETPVVTANGGTWEIFPSVANWAISLSSGLELWRGIVIPSNGLQNVELDGDNATKITQATTTIPGATYELRVDFAARTADKADNNINMLVDGTVAKNVNSANTNWTTYGKTFVAASTSTEIGFEDIGTPQDPGGTGSLIDNAVLCLVREPIVEPVKACEVTVVSDTTNTFQSNPAALAWVHPAWMQEITGSVAKWIWGTEKVTDPSATTTQTFTKTFIWNGPLTVATLKIAADNSYSVKLNGVEFNVGDGFASADTYNMTTFLQTNIVSGVNTLEITGTNWSWSTQNPDENPAGVIYDLNIVGNTNINCKVAPTDGGDGDGGDTDGGDGTDVNEISNRRSGGNGGTRIARAPRGEVLGAASSTPVGMVLGEATSTLPVGAPNTGAGGTAPVTVSLPTLVAVLSTATRRSK